MSTSEVTQRAAADAYSGFGNSLLTEPDGSDNRAWDYQRCQTVEPDRFAHHQVLRRIEERSEDLQGRTPCLVAFMLSRRAKEKSDYQP